MNIKNKARYGGFVSKWILSITLAVFCLPCLSYAQNSGVVVFYLEKVYKGYTSNPKIVANGKPICVVKSNSKSPISMKEGEYVLQVKPNMKQPLSIKITPNDTLFVKLNLITRYMNAFYEMTLTDKKQGRMESDLLKEGRNK
jgi:hypothetical protein